MMALCATGILTGATYRGLSLIVKNMTGQTISIASGLQGEPVLRKTLYSLDVVTKLETVQSLLSILQGHEQTEPVNRLLLGMSNSIADLQIAMTDSRAKINHHRSNWFYSWRTVDLTVEIERIEMAVTVLDGQLDTLYKIVNVLHILLS